MAANATEGIDWERWSVVLLTPDCIRRNLVGPIRDWLSRDVDILDERSVVVTEKQIMAYYGYLVRRSRRFGVDVRSELRRAFVDQTVTVALVYGPQGTAERVQAVLGPHVDPSPDTIRGRYGIEASDAARAQGRLPDILVDSSHAAVYVESDLKVWFRPHAHRCATWLDQLSR